eukprot:gene264-479_t
MEVSHSEESDTEFVRQMRLYDARDMRRRSSYDVYARERGHLPKKLGVVRSLILSCETLSNLIPKGTPEGRIGARAFEQSFRTLEESSTLELHHFYANVVNYPMRNLVVCTNKSAARDEVYTFLRNEVRDSIRMNPDPANNLALKLVVDESYIDAPIIFTGTNESTAEQEVVAARANWVESLRPNRLVLNGGGVSDLPQLLQKRNYDRVSKTALCLICNVYVCGLHKRRESPVSVCDHMLLLAAEQASVLFPKDFDSYILGEIEKGASRAPREDSYTYDASLTWPTEAQGIKFRNRFLKYLFEQEVIDCPVLDRLRKMCGAVLDELKLAPAQISVARGFIWAEMCVLNVQFAIAVFLKYGPKSDGFRPADGSSGYTDHDIAQFFFEVADGEGIHSRYDAVTVFHTPPSAAHGDVLPMCPICTNTTHYSNDSFCSTKNAVVNCRECLQPIHVGCFPNSKPDKSVLSRCPYCRASGDWLVDVAQVKAQFRNFEL